MGDPVEDTFLLMGRVVGARYAVERPVARGGFGVVYKARHVELSSPVALKVLAASALDRDDAALVERFRLEARTLAALRHPSIVRVYDVGLVDTGASTHIWMALEWLDGVTLDRDLAEREGRGRSPREALALLAPALDAIACAHDRGIAHRDLKPANLMLTPTPGGQVEVRVLDFGIAKEMRPDEAPGTGRTQTRDEVSAFSLSHAAPEQLSRVRTGPWTDVHALGLLVIELLTGASAYEGADSFALYAAVMSSERPTPARRGVAVGPWEPLLRRAVALHPGDRYPHAGALRDALTETVEAAQRAYERPVAVAVARPPRDARRTLRRYAPLGAAAAVFTAIALGRWASPPSPAPPVGRAPASVSPPSTTAPPAPHAPAPVALRDDRATDAAMPTLVDASIAQAPTVSPPSARRVAQRPGAPVRRRPADPEVVVE